jgi:hypothetical protein
LVGEDGQEAPGAYSAMSRAHAMSGGGRRDRLLPTSDPAIGDFEDAVIGWYGETPEDLIGFTSIA